MKLFLLALVLAFFAMTVEAGCGVRRSGLRRQLLGLHRQAARCGDTDTACVDRVFNRIHRVRRGLSSLRCGARARPRTVRCTRRMSFQDFSEARRARISRIAARCGAEDEACVSAALNLLVAINSDLPRQRRIWRRSCPRAAARRLPVPTTRSATDAPLERNTEDAASIWAQQRSWTHEFLCSRIRRGFRRWLHFQIQRRASFHRESSLCNPSDLPCLHMNYQAIIRIQRTIRHARTLYAKRISRCDECAPIKMRWHRWLRRQRTRRHRLQLQACRCPESDPACMQRQVDRIKRIQVAIRTRLRQVLALHGSCQNVTDVPSGDELRDL